MRTTLNISDDVIAETQAIYDSKNRSNAVEQALKDAIRFKKLQKLFALKGKITFDEEYLEEQRRAEIDESEDAH
jgi:Arc/MetJ family transcription regulator